MYFIDTAVQHYLNDVLYTSISYTTGMFSLTETHYFVERGSSVGRMPDSKSREPGFESPLLPFRSFGIFFHFTTPQSTQLYK